MPQTPSILGLHLRYRIWIAEMNADITILRIFDDYLEGLMPAKTDIVTRTAVDGFKKEFDSFRKEMEELKHEMHLLKMKLAANAREEKDIDKKLYVEDNHAALQIRYTAFRKSFSKMKTELELIKDNWVD